MAIKSQSKINPEFSMSSMTDIVFLLLIFFMVTSTLVNPNALKLLLPKSNNQAQTSRNITVSITGDLKFYINRVNIPKNQVEAELQKLCYKYKEPSVSLYADQEIPIKYIVELMNITKNLISAENKKNCKLILSTRQK